MDFSDRLRNKIAERQAGVVARAKTEQEIRLRKKFAPLITALEAMRDRLHKDQLFADVIGQPDLTFKLEDDVSCTLEFKGRLATLHVTVLVRWDRFDFSIWPDNQTGRAWNYLNYGPTRSVEGRAANLDEFIAAAEDHVADFLADLATNPTTANLLSKSSTADRGFGI